MQAAFGFGFAILAAPLFLVVMESTGAIPVLALLNLGVSALVAARMWRQAPPRLLALLCTASVAGFPLGLILFRSADVSHLKWVTGVVIMLFAALLFARERWQAAMGPDATSATQPPASITLVFGGLSGVMGAALAMPGPAAMLYLSSARLPKDQSRALALAFFSFVYAGACLLHAWDGGLSVARATLAAKLMVAVVAGAIAGHALARHIPEARFRRLVLAILFFAGLSAVLSA